MDAARSSPSRPRSPAVSWSWARSASPDRPGCWWPASSATGSRTCGSTAATLWPTPAGGRRSAWSSTESPPPSWSYCSPSASTSTTSRAPGPAPVAASSSPVPGRKGNEAIQQPTTIVSVLYQTSRCWTALDRGVADYYRRFALTEIALFLYDGMTALDAVGPYEVLARLPDAEVKFIASTPGPKKTDVGLVLTADSSLDHVPTPDIIVIPGSGKVPFLEDPAAVEWVRRAHETSRWTTSVCTGSMLLGAAGILQGKRATSHWAVRDYLRNFGAEPVAERVVIEGKVITAGGVSAGIDMALTLAAREAGEDEARALQLVIEYDPQPPYDSGSLEKAEPETKQRATEVLTRGVA